MCGGVGLEIFDYDNPYVFTASLHNGVERSGAGACLGMCSFHEERDFLCCDGICRTEWSAGGIFHMASAFDHQQETNPFSGVSSSSVSQLPLCGDHWVGQVKGGRCFAKPGLGPCRRQEAARQPCI